MSARSIRAVLWDADGVLQHTPASSWDLAVQVVSQFPDALVGAPIDETRILAVARRLGLGDHADDILAAWSRFDVLGPSLEVVSQVRAAGTACYLATNQDSHRAACMRRGTPYESNLDGAYYSCDLAAAKPSSAFFEHIAHDLDLASHQLLFVDDQAKNVQGARSAGLRAEQWAFHDGIPRLRDLLDAHGVPTRGPAA